MPRLTGLALGKLLPIICLLYAGTAAAAGLDTHPAVALRVKYAELGQHLSNNQFDRPLYLASMESPAQLAGDIYALVDHPFAQTSKVLSDPEHWCDILILHLNTKYCRASTSQAGNFLDVRIGRKTYQELADTYQVGFAFKVATQSSEYFDVRLTAATGPFGVRDNLLRLEAVALQGSKTFLHLTYACAYDPVARLAMQGYLETIGRGKVGFSPAGDATSPSAFIGGMRGVVERNAMRYYLAIDAYLEELTSPPAEQNEKRLQRWFAATESYPVQLHEIDRAEYLDMKRREYLRQQKPP